MELNRQSTLAEEAYEKVEGLLVTLQLEPGTVFSEAELSQAIGIGRTPLREALLRLSLEGLIQSIPRRGMMVSPIDLAQMLHIIEARKALDQLIVAGAARKASGHGRARIRTALADMTQLTAASDPVGFMRADFRLDQSIWDAAPNKYAVEASKPLHIHCRRFWYRYREDEDLHRSEEMHTAVVQAVLSGDSVAAVERSDRLMDYLTLFTKHILIA